MDEDTGTGLDSEDANMSEKGCCWSAMMSCPNQERDWHFCPPLYEIMDLRCIDSRGRDYFEKCWKQKYKSPSAGVLPCLGGLDRGNRKSCY